MHLQQQCRPRTTHTYPCCCLHPHASPPSVSPPDAAGYNTYSAFEGYAHLSSGLCVGLAAVAAGLAIGVVGDAGVRAISQQPKLFASIMLILVFAEALGLYGLIVSLTISSASPAGNVCAP